MKKQTALFALLLATALMATNAVAQRGGGGGGGGNGGGGGGKSNSANKDGTKDQKTQDASNAELEDLTSKLTLTDPQKAQVKTILNGRDTQLEALKKEKLPKDETKDKSKDLKDAAHDKIRTLLTPNQQIIFDKAYKKSGKKAKDETAEGAPAATPAPAAAPAATPAPPTS